ADDTTDEDTGDDDGDAEEARPSLFQDDKVPKLACYAGHAKIPAQLPGFDRSRLQRRHVQPELLQK
ncbi:hypothetical protein NL521_28640, partial [Klebsiella pneumoniae]|nr:hypothetical protein [Klebsiella pneumoniae]